jgi:hypothetical protein
MLDSSPVEVSNILTIELRHPLFSLQHAHNRPEWIKGLLAVPFVLHSQPTGVFESRCGTIAQMAEEAHRRYAEIMKDVEDMIDDHSKCP